MFDHPSSFLVLAVVLLGGLVFGTLARRLHLPSITGQIVAGVLLGSAGFDVFAAHDVERLSPITDFALGLMGVTVGAHLSFRRLRNARLRLGLLVLMESLLVPGLIFGGLAVAGVRWSVGLLFGAIAVSTAPATIVALVREARSKGVYTKTLIAAVALNNIACIILFELARVAAHIDLTSAEWSAWDLLLTPLSQLLQALLLGCSTALGMRYLSRWSRRPQFLVTGGLLGILLTWGVATQLGISPLLACVFIGLAQTNLISDRSQVIDRLFSDFEQAILAVFFTLAGMELNFDHFAQVGLVALLFFGLRMAGKFSAAWLAMRMAGATAKLRNFLGLALVPQAGVAIGLILLLEQDHAIVDSGGELLPLFAAVVLTAVVANEIVGPVLTRFGIHRSGEANRDRTRLIDFIHEENIVTDFHCASFEEALESLSDLLITSHHLDPKLRQPILTAILRREAEFSTCLGGGLAVPHGVLPTGDAMLGVLAISREGLQLETPDGEPIHYIVVIATPESQRDRHLQVLAAIAHTLGHDTKIKEGLLNAASPAEAYEILHNEESEDFNYFLDEAPA